MDKLLKLLITGFMAVALCACGNTTTTKTKTNKTITKGERAVRC